MSRQSRAYNRIFSRRLFLTTAAHIAAFGAVTWRYFDLQVNEREKYRTLSDNNRFVLRLNVPERGKIRDGNNRIIADNLKRFRLSLIPENALSVEETLRRLQALYPVSDEQLLQIQERLQVLPKFTPIVVADYVSDTVYDRIMVNYHRLPGLHIDEVAKRVYPYGEKLSHISGYIGSPTEEDIKADPYNERLMRHDRFTIGRSGMEKLANETLRGLPGAEKLEVNAHGRPLRSEVVRATVSGEDIRLTLDAELQSFIYDLLAATKAGSAVVLDAKSGAILAAVSVPSYDCNEFIGGISQEAWDKFITDALSPLTNRAFRSVYPPGSVFKPIVALAALRDGKAASTSHFCAGRITLGDSTFRCWKEHGHGKMDMYGAIRESCDVWFYETARRLGIEKIAAEARLFGLGSGYDWPENEVKEGLIGTPAWKKQTHKENWYLGDTLVASIGQGYVLCSPLQLAVMTARLGSGNMALRPHLLPTGTTGATGAETATEPSRLYDLPDNLEYVREALLQVVNDEKGTAYKSRLGDKSFRMAGKTGTSQVRRLSDAERERIENNEITVPWKFREHALFIGYAPYEEPRYAVAVIVEHGGSGSAAAAPVARKIIEYLRDTDKKQNFI